jgi:HSP20 family protein
VDAEMLWSDPFASLFTPVLRGAAFLPAADVAVSEGDLLLTMDLPGLTSDDLEIELVDGHLFVRGERKQPALSEGTLWAHRERGFGRFERRIELPKGVDADKITASMDNGVLSLIVPKPERLRPRTIAIGPGEQQRQLQTANA